jgi:hypothetical protein
MCHSHLAQKSIQAPESVLPGRQSIQGGLSPLWGGPCECFLGDDHKVVMLLLHATGVVFTRVLMLIIALYASRSGAVSFFPMSIYA